MTAGLCRISFTESSDQHGLPGCLPFLSCSREWKRGSAQDMIGRRVGAAALARMISGGMDRFFVYWDRGAATEVVLGRNHRFIFVIVFFTKRSRTVILYSQTQD